MSDCLPPVEIFRPDHGYTAKKPARKNIECGGCEETMMQTSTPRAVRRTARLTGLRLLVVLIAGMLPLSHPAVLHSGPPTGLEEYLWLDVGATAALPGSRHDPGRVAFGGGDQPRGDRPRRCRD